MSAVKRSQGRPPLDEKGVTRLTFAVSNDYAKKLRKQAKANGQTLSELIRELLAA